MPILKKTNIKIRNLILIASIFFIQSTHLFSQTGNYYITNYSPANYHAGEQNRGVVQDKFGRIFIANPNGVLIYDGEYWKLLPVDGGGNVLSISVDKFGTLFIGSENEFGYLESEENGKYVYVSLIKKIDKKNTEIGSVWSTLCFDNKVFFASPDYLIIYDYNLTKCIESATGDFFKFFNVGKHLFVREDGKGIWVYINNKLEFVENSESFSDIRIRSILPLKDNLYWVFTESGLFQLSYNSTNPKKSIITKVKSNLDDWLINNQVYFGKELKNGTYLLGSTKAGLLNLSRDLTIINSINSNSGLRDNYIYSIYEDYSENIWLSLNNGLSYVEMNSPITKWTKLDGIIGTIEATLLYKDKLFIATDKGLQFKDAASQKFENTPIKTEVWSLDTINDKLLIGGNGLSLFSNNNFQVLYGEGSTVYKVFCSKHLPRRIYVGGEGFISIGELTTANEFKVLKEIEINGIARNATDYEGKIYFGVDDVGIIEINKENFDTTIYPASKDLSDLSDNYPFVYNNKLFIASSNGLLNFNLNNNQKIHRDSVLNPFKKTDQIGKPLVIGNQIFFQRTYQSEQISKIDELSSVTLINGKFVVDKKYLHRIRDVDAKHFDYYNNKLFISTNDGLFAYDLLFKNKVTDYNTFISSIYTNKDTISDTLFSNLSESKDLNIQFEYASNQINFDIAASNYIDKKEMEFAFYLEGNNDAYGKWTKNNTATYSNLHEGKYIFHAKSRDVLGHEGKEISFSFQILPPWYRTTWAYITYFILFVIVVWIIVALNTKRLRAQNIKLENTITERTKTIAHQMVEIEHKNKEITDSINYAKGIQDSILPDVAEIKKTWKDTFVYFQPKDIVSGDFFWYKKINDHEFLIACADCTGHGVPGGFMSMICSDKLHDSAKDSTQPKDILFGTNNGVKTTLKQEIIVEGKSKDGMEVCLLKINTKTQEVNYSGANRLLWIVDGETKELTEIKPTKASIASFTEFNFEYQQHDFKLKKGDIIYATSDGFPDQFGGGDGKKYMSKKMKAFILSICDLPMDEQHDLLKKEINDWMMGHEQVDDLLVIGVRL